MPTATLLPNAAGSQGSTGVAANSGTIITAIQTNDDDTSYVYNSGAGGANSGYNYWYPQVLTGAATIVGNPTHYYRVTDKGWGGVGGSICYLGASSDAEANHYISGHPTYTTYSYAHVRPGGGTWVPTDFATAVQFTWNPASSTVIADEWRHTYSYVSVTYVVVAGTFAFLAGSLAGAALGLAEMSGLARAVYRKTRTLITPAEYREAWQDIRDAKRRVYSISRLAASV